MTALALLASYVEEIKIALVRIGQDLPNGVEAAKATLVDFMEAYNVNLMNPVVLVGVFIGAMMAFVFCGMTMNAGGSPPSVQHHQGYP